MPDWSKEVRAAIARLKLGLAQEVSLVEELSQHLDDRYNELRGKGTGDVEACRLLREELNDGRLVAELGSILPPKPETAPPGLDRKGALFAGLGGDLRQALRLLRLNPGFTTVAILCCSPDGRHADVPSYTAWWLRRHPVLGGHRPTDVRAAGADPLLAGLYDETALPADPAVARALGVRTSLAELLAEPGGADELLARMADPGRPVTRAQLRALWTALAAVAEAAPPDRVRVVCGNEIVVADAGDALVLDAPDLWPLVAAPSRWCWRHTTGPRGSLTC